MNKLICSLVVVASLIVMNDCMAQDSNVYEGINSDRPGQSFSASNLEKGQLSLQTGTFISLNKNVNPKYTSNAFVRYGLFNRLEVGFGSGYTRNIPLSGYKSDAIALLPTVSVRGQVLFENKYTPAVGLHLDYTNAVRFVKDDFAQRETFNIDSYQLRISLSKNLNENISVSTNISREVFGDGNLELPINYTFNLGYSHFNFGTFLEIYGAFQKNYVLGIEPNFSERMNNSTKRRLLNFDTGFWYQITQRTRLDITIGRNDGGYEKRFDRGQYFTDIGATILLR